MITTDSMKFILLLAICLLCNMFFTPKCSQYTPTYTVCTACVPCATPMRPNLSRICENHLSEEYFLRTNTLTEYASFSDIIQFTILLFVLVLSISVCFCKNLDVKFISFDTNLSLLKQYPEKKDKDWVVSVFDSITLFSNWHILWHKYCYVPTSPYWRVPCLSPTFRISKVHISDRSFCILFAVAGLWIWFWKDIFSGNFHDDGNMNTFQDPAQPGRRRRRRRGRRSKTPEGRELTPYEQRKKELRDRRNVRNIPYIIYDFFLSQASISGLFFWIQN